MERLVEWIFEHLLDIVAWGVALAFLAGLSILIVAGYHADVAERAEWQAWAIEHSCRIVERRQAIARAGTGTGLTSNGKLATVLTVSTDPAMTGWYCDDGVVYWRETSDGPATAGAHP